MIKNFDNRKFWIEGNGNDFVTWANSTIEEAQHEESLFYAYDEQIDKLVKKWLQNGEFSSIMKSLHGENHSDLPQDYIDLKSNMQSIPNWVNMELIHKGCELSQRSGLTGLLVLRNFALLGGYNFANLTKPLVATGALEKGAVHRLYNTLNFWVNTSRTGELAQHERINACIRTRLVHCASRLMIQEKQPNWNVERYGVPINHADMIATHIAFTVYFLYGLDQLNFPYSEEEEEGLFHLWEYITFLLGVPEELIPTNTAESLSFFKFWTLYQVAPDEDSIKLTNSLLNENTPISLFKLAIIKRNMGYIHKSISNFLLDERTRNVLHVPEVRFKNVIPKAIQLKNEISENRENQIKKGNLEQLSVLDDYNTQVHSSH